MDHQCVSKASRLKRIATWAGLAATLGLSACGGGGSGGGAAAAAGAFSATCDPKLTTLTTPTLDEVAKYAGTFTGDEGGYTGVGGSFVKSGTAVMVLKADGSLSYKGVDYALTSVCINKTADVNFGKLLLLGTAKGHFDIAEPPKTDATLGAAWGSSPADGTTVFTNSVKS
jgi:ABC-type glycerol-3-phosphate transport system substrate-binding protein